MAEERLTSGIFCTTCTARVHCVIVMIDTIKRKKNTMYDTASTEMCCVLSPRSVRIKFSAKLEYETIVRSALAVVMVM